MAGPTVPRRRPTHRAVRGGRSLKLLRQEPRDEARYGPKIGRREVSKLPNFGGGKKDLHAHLDHAVGALAAGGASSRHGRATGCPKEMRAAHFP